MLVYPDYYPEFRCSASACKHNCCIGWEIDIDAETMKKYGTVEGELGRRLRSGIECGEEPHFILGKDGRCPFLNGDNLCELILHGDEDMLCEICTVHPRFRTFLSDRTELGLGLCCETAARLILGKRSAVRLIAEGAADGTPDSGEAELLALRDRVIALLQNRELPLHSRAEQVLTMCAAIEPDGPIVEWIPEFIALERLDEGWTEMLEQLRQNAGKIDHAAFNEAMKGREHEYEQLLVYFIYRHFMTALYDGDVGGKAAFALLGTRLIYELGAMRFTETGAFGLSDQIETVRMYSSEVEYSQENLDAMFDLLA